MDTAGQKQAAEVIWSHWAAGTVMTALPEQLCPTSRAEGYAIQGKLAEAAKDHSVGWKIAATSEAGQKHIGVSGPLAGRIFSRRVHGDGATLSLTSNRMRVAEPEFAFRFGTSLSPRATPYATEEVMAAVAQLHLALELPDSRFATFVSAGEAALIADDACARDLVLGPAVAADWRQLDLSQHEVNATVVSRYDRTGRGRMVLGDPRIALTWLVNELSGLGITMEQGHFVTTGTCMVPLDIIPGDTVSANFGSLGAISCRLA